MIGLYKVSQILAVLAVIQAQGSQHQTLDAWERFRSLAAPTRAEQTPELKEELFAYVRSLSLDDLLTTAREGCVAGENKPKLTMDWERNAAAESNALLCFEIYFDVLFRDDDRTDDLDTVTKKLIDILDDEVELSCLRSAVVSRLSGSRNTLFADRLHTYVHANLAQVEITLKSIVKNQTESVLFRRAAIRALIRAIGEELSAIVESDANVRELVTKKRKHTNKVIHVNQLVRSGEVSLSEETLNALKPFKERIRDLVGILGTILSDAEEPKQLRQEARRTLEGYRRSAITQFDDAIGRALQQAAPITK